MDFVVDQFTFLGLNEREVKVFTALGTFGRMNMTKLASRSQLPRTTVDAIVRRLLAQGLIVKEKIEGHFEYSMKPGEVADKLDWLEQRLRPKPGEQEVSDEVHKTDEKNVNSAIPIDFLAEQCRVHHGDRVRLMFAGIQEERKEDTILRFSQYATLAIKHKLMFEVLVSSYIADMLCGMKDAIPTPEHADRIRLNIVPASYGATGKDVCMFRDSIVFIDAQNVSFEEIRERSHVELCIHLLTVACEVGWSVDLTAWLNKLRHINR